MITLNATSPRHARSTCRDERNPTEYEYNSNTTHHRRVISRATLPVRAIRPIKPIQIHLLDRAEHRPQSR